jgi:hypothetical protein
MIHMSVIVIALLLFGLSSAPASADEPAAEAASVDTQNRPMVDG